MVHALAIQSNFHSHNLILHIGKLCQAVIMWPIIWNICVAFYGKQFWSNQFRWTAWFMYFITALWWGWRCFYHIFLFKMKWSKKNTVLNYDMSFESRCIACPTQSRPFIQTNGWVSKQTNIMPKRNLHISDGFRSNWYKN